MIRQRKRKVNKRRMEDGGCREEENEEKQGYIENLYRIMKEVLNKFEKVTVSKAFTLILFMTSTFDWTASTDHKNPGTVRQLNN